MGNQIIKQPDGRYAIWSSVVDDFTVLDCTLPELLGECAAQAARDTTTRVMQIVAELDAGGKPYYQFTMSWDEAQAGRRDIHDEDN